MLTPSESIPRVRKGQNIKQAAQDGCLALGYRQAPWKYKNFMQICEVLVVGFRWWGCGWWNQGQSSVFCHFELFLNVLWIYTLCSKTGKGRCVYYLSNDPIAGLADPPQLRETQFLPGIQILSLCLSLWNNQVTFLGNSGESAQLLYSLVHKSISISVLCI